MNVGGNNIFQTMHFLQLRYQFGAQLPQCSRYKILSISSFIILETANLPKMFRFAWPLRDKVFYKIINNY
jgi:hypothetical protein